MSYFERETWLSGVVARKDARLLAQQLAASADQHGEIELTMAQLRALVSSDPATADPAVDYLRQSRRLAMTQRPAFPGGPITWRLTDPNGAVYINPKES